MKKQYHSKKSKTTNKNVNIKFDSKDDTVFQSIVKDAKGNANSLKFIMSPSAPDIQQRIKYDNK